MLTSNKSTAALLALCAAAVLSAIGSAQAQLVTYEGFNYASPSLEGQTGGTGWGLNWSTNVYASPISSASLSYGSLTTSGGSVTLGPTNVTTVYTRQLGSTFGAMALSSNVWVSLLYLNSAGSTSAEARIGFYSGMVADASGVNTVTASAGTIQVVDVGRAGSGSDVISLYNGTVINSTGVATPRGSNAVFLLLRFVMDGGSGPDTVYLWVNADLSAGAPVIGTQQASWTTSGTTNFESINGLRFQTPSSGGFRVDEIRIGKTFADVTPHIANVLPVIQSSLSGGNVNLSWSAVDGAGFNLQSASNLVPPVAWSDLSPDLTTNLNTISTALPATHSQTFFRLKK